MAYKLGFVKRGAFTLIRTYDTKEQTEEAKSNLNKRSIYKGILTIKKGD